MFQGRGERHWRGRGFFENSQGFCMRRGCRAPGPPWSAAADLEGVPRPVVGRGRNEPAVKLHG